MTSTTRASAGSERLVGAFGASWTTTGSPPNVAAVQLATTFASEEATLSAPPEAFFWTGGVAFPELVDVCQTVKWLSTSVGWPSAAIVPRMT